ncbi:hypothetical protein DAETH_28530 [Deinococcus aetherius]|uniref:AAA+ ATPase domain-containing protein n=1 Tax=Deinococcus aetherius TaxID=200252 RepID=A0ABM8AGU0_9DEIO|nr:AAA family ATPase [Deinococcus aetherius]BDP42884.1 hypothetical protein DAETH_28530 [Deinococcus aetherius]
MTKAAKPTALVSAGKVVGIDLREADLSDTRLPANFKLTSNFREIVGKIQLAWSLHDTFCLITGANGCGKSTAVAFMAQQEGVLLVHVQPKYQPKHLVDKFAELLGVNAGSGWRAQTSVVVSQLREDPKLIILDEGQRLDYDCLDTLKYIGDESGCTFVLVANVNLERIIEKNPDIDSRVGTRVRVGSMTLEEFVRLYQPDGYAEDVLGEMHKLTSGVYRRLDRLLSKLVVAMEEAGLSPAELKIGHLRHLVKEVLQ